MKIIAPRMAAMNESIVGGQNFLCKCKGKCISNVCLCYKTTGHADPPAIGKVSVARIMINKSWTTRTRSRRMGKQMQR